MVTLSFLARFRALKSQRDSVSSYTKALVSTPSTLPNEIEIWSLTARLLLPLSVISGPTEPPDGGAPEESAA